MVKNDDRIVGLLEKLLDKFTSLETRLNAKVDECDMYSLEQRITGLEIRMADDNVNDRMVAMESKYNKVEEIDRKLKDLEGRLNNELDWNVGGSKVVEDLDKKEELDKEQRKKNIIIYKLNEIDSEEAEDTRCGDSLQVYELCESMLKVPITEGDNAKTYRLGARESGKIRPLLVSFTDIGKKFEVFRMLNELKSANDKFKIEFCTGPGAGVSRGSPAGFPAKSGLKFRKIPRCKRERDCKLRCSRGSGTNFRGTPVGTGSRPHGEFRYVVLKVWCLW